MVKDKVNLNLNTLITATLGFATVSLLAWSHVIVDGETVAAMSAVLTSTVAIHKKGGNDDG